MPLNAAVRSTKSNRSSTLARHGLGELAGTLEHLVEPPRDVPRVDARLVGLRVDRDELAGAVADEVDDGVRHLLATLVHVELAEHEHLHPRPQLPLPPRLVEEREPQVRRRRR